MKLAALLFAQLVTVSPPPTNTSAVPSTTVASLPTCSASATGQIYQVTNALTPIVGSVVAGGGAVTLLVHCNGTSWIAG